MGLLGGPDDVFAPRGPARRRLGTVLGSLLGALLGAMAAALLLHWAAPWLAAGTALRAGVIALGAAAGAWWLGRPARAATPAPRRSSDTPGTPGAP